MHNEYIMHTRKEIKEISNSQLVWASHGSPVLSAKGCELAGCVGLLENQKKLLVQLGATKGTS
jgi:hypothetical protein